AFGCVLFEVLTGRSAFGHETVADTIAAVLHSEPAWGDMPATTPGPVQRLVRRCLERDVRRRQRDIGDARLEIEESLAAPEEPGSAAHAAAGRDVQLRRLTDFAAYKEAPAISPDG